MQKRFIIAFLAAILIAGSITYFSTRKNEVNNIEGAQALKEEVVKVKIAYLPVVQGLPLYMAIEKGYFEEAGLEVEAVKFDSPNLIIDALLSGQVDFGSPSTATGITAISQLKKPNSLKIFALNGSNGFNFINDILITQIDSDIKTAEDLKGKKLGILPGIQFRTIAKHIMEQNALNENDVEIIDIAPALQVQALAQGQVDAVLSLEPTRTIAINKKIGRDLITHPMVRYISDPWYGSGGVVNVEFMNKYPRTTEKIIEIFKRTSDEINENPEMCREYLKNYTPLDEELMKEVPLHIFKTYQDFDEKDINGLQKFFDIFYAHGVIEEKVDAHSLIYEPQNR